MCFYLYIFHSGSPAISHLFLVGIGCLSDPTGWHTHTQYTIHISLLLVTTCWRSILFPSPWAFALRITAEKANRKKELFLLSLSFALSALCWSIWVQLHSLLIAVSGEIQFVLFGMLIAYACISGTVTLYCTTFLWMKIDCVRIFYASPQHSTTLSLRSLKLMVCYYCITIFFVISLPLSRSLSLNFAIFLFFPLLFVPLALPQFCSM